MQKPPGVGLLQGFGDLAGHVQCIGESHTAFLQAAMQRYAGDKLHHQKQRVAVFADFEDLANIRMVKRGSCPCLAAQPFTRLRVGSYFRRQELNGDLTIQPRVARTVYHAHATLTDAGMDFIRTQPASRKLREPGGGVESTRSGKAGEAVRLSISSSITSTLLAISA